MRGFKCVRCGLPVRMGSIHICMDFKRPTSRLGMNHGGDMRRPPGRGIKAVNGGMARSRLQNMAKSLILAV